MCVGFIYITRIAPQNIISNYAFLRFHACSIHSDYICIFNTYFLPRFIFCFFQARATRVLTRCHYDGSASFLIILTRQNHSYNTLHYVESFTVFIHFYGLDSNIVVVVHSIAHIISILKRKKFRMD